MGAVKLSEASKYVLVVDEAIAPGMCFFCGVNHGGVIEYTPRLNTTEGLFLSQYTKHHICQKCRSILYYENVVQAGSRFGHNMSGLMTVEEKMKRIGQRAKAEEISIKVNRASMNVAKKYGCFIPIDCSMSLDDKDRPLCLISKDQVSVPWDEVIRVQGVVCAFLMELEKPMLQQLMAASGIAPETEAIFNKALELEASGW